MEQNHISYFYVENFKKFETLEVKNLGQFNLIVGDNNVGKTSFLEALLINKSGHDFVSNLFYILTSFKRFHSLKEEQTFNFFLDYFFYDKKITNGRLLSFKIIENSQTHEYFLKRNQPSLPNELIWQNNGNIENIRIDGFRNSDRNYRLDLNIPFVPFGMFYDHEITNYFSAYIQQNPHKRKLFQESLKKILPQLEIIDVNPLLAEKAILLITESEKNMSLPLGTFGDGFLKLFKLLIAITVNTNNRLMIDEIDTGVYYKRLKDYWKSMILSSIENNVQIFATTHSKECIEYFKIALEELELQEKGRVIKFALDINKKPKAYTYTFNEFEHSLSHDNELR